MHDLDLAVHDQEGGDDDLADVADRGIHDPADARTRRDAELLGRVAEGVGQPQDRQRGHAEGQRVIGTEDAQGQREDRAADGEPVGDLPEHCG
jgi:hypothetical protein